MSYTYRGKGRAPKTATRAGQPSLLAYVIAYLQEEQKNAPYYGRQRARSVRDLLHNPAVIVELVEAAISTFEASFPAEGQKGGAR